MSTSTKSDPKPAAPARDDKGDYLDSPYGAGKPADKPAGE